MIRPGRGRGKGKTGVWRFFFAALMIAAWHPGGVMGQTLHLGNPTVVEAFADRTPFGAVFEDDGKVAYLYGLDTRLGDNPIVDSVCVYNVSELLTRPIGVLDVHEPYDVELVWSPDQHRVVLLLNRYPHAAFDFASKRAYCRSNFPPGSRWSASGHAWDDRAVDFLASR